MQRAFLCVNCRAPPNSSIFQVMADDTDMELAWHVHFQIVNIGWYTTDGTSRSPEPEDSDLRNVIFMIEDNTGILYLQCETSCALSGNIVQMQVRAADAGWPTQTSMRNITFRVHIVDEQPGIPVAFICVLGTFLLIANGCLICASRKKHYEISYTELE